MIRFPNLVANNCDADIIILYSCVCETVYNGQTLSDYYWIIIFPAVVLAFSHQRRVVGRCTRGGCDGTAGLASVGRCEIPKRIHSASKSAVRALFNGTLPPPTAAVLCRHVSGAVCKLHLIAASSPPPSFAAALLDYHQFIILLLLLLLIVIYNSPTRIFISHRVRTVES